MFKIKDIIYTYDTYKLIPETDEPDQFFSVAYIKVVNDLVHVDVRELVDSTKEDLRDNVGRRMFYAVINSNGEVTISTMADVYIGHPIFMNDYINALDYVKEIAYDISDNGIVDISTNEEL